MNKFMQVGTKHKTYIQRFMEKWSSFDKVTFNVIDDHNIEFYSGDKIIDKFSSKAAYKQFLLTCEALGFLSKTASGFKVISSSYDFKSVTNAIFTTSDDIKVNIYRDSRKLCFLYRLNLINDKTIKERSITKRRGMLKVVDLEKECSTWETGSTASFPNIQYVIERIKYEYKI